MTATDVDKAILADLDGTDKDWVVLGILADWYNDAGDDVRKEAVDFLLKHKRRPRWSERSQDYEFYPPASESNNTGLGMFNTNPHYLSLEWILNPRDWKFCFGVSAVKTVSEAYQAAIEAYAKGRV